jgi:hypothetical protein
MKGEKCKGGESGFGRCAVCEATDFPENVGKRLSLPTPSRANGTEGQDSKRNKEQENEIRLTSVSGPQPLYSNAHRQG